jgi:hypothetical protein
VRKKLTKAQNQILALRDSAIKGYDRTLPEFMMLEQGYMATLDENVINDLKRRRKSFIAPQIIRAKVRKIERDIMKTYFSLDELGKIEIENDKELTIVMQKKLNEYASHKLNLYTLMRPNVRDMLIYGTTIAKVYWSSAKNQLIVQPRLLSEICIDPYARSHFDAKFIVDRFYMTIADIKKHYKPPRGFKFDEVIGNTSSNHDNLKEQDGDLGDYTRIEVQEVYREVDGKWRVSTIVGGDGFIRADVELKDGHPFIFGKVYPQFIGLKERSTVRSYGDSYIAPMIPLQTQYIVTRNQQMDAIDLQLNPRFITTRNSGLRDDDLNSNKKKIVVSSLDSVREMPFPRIDQSIFDTNKIDEEIQEVGGLPKFAQGIATSNDPKSATGANLLAENGAVTVEDIITSFNESFFQPMIMRMLKLIYKYEVSVDFAGMDRQKDISMKVSINAGVGAMSREMRLQGIENALLSLGNTVKLLIDAGMNEKALDYLVIIDELTKEKAKLLGIKNIERRIEDGRREYIGRTSNGGRATAQDGAQAETGGVGTV